MAQLSAIRTEVLETAGLSSSDPRVPSATLNRIINRALRRIGSEMDWPWLQSSETITTSSGTQAYNLAADHSKSIAFTLTSRSKDLPFIPRREAARYGEDTGEPIAYFIEEDQVHFIPVPDGVYTIEHVYYAYEATLTNDTDVPELPDRYIDLLVAHAIMLIGIKIRDNDLYNMGDNERKDWYNRMKDEARPITAGGRPKTRTDWWMR